MGIFPVVEKNITVISNHYSGEEIDSVKISILGQFIDVSHYEVIRYREWVK